MDSAAKPLSTPLLLHAPWLIPSLILVVGLGITYGLRHTAQNNAHAEAAAHFQARVDSLTGDIASRLIGHEQVLRGAGALWAASDTVTRDEFHEYARQMRLTERYPGLRTVGYAIALTPEDVDAHEHAVRAEGYPSYSIHPPGRRPIYSAVRYLEPMDPAKQGTLGRDMLTEPQIRPAMLRARDQNQLSETGLVALSILESAIDTDGDSGFAWFLPVFVNGLGDTAQPDPLNRFQGWIYGIFHMPALMAGLLDRQLSATGGLLAFRIYDQDRAASNALLYDSLSESTVQWPAHSAFQSQTRIDFAGRPWTIVAHSLPGFETTLAGATVRFITLAGVAASLLAAIIAWLLATGRERAYRQARELAGQYQAEEARTRRLNRALKLLSACNMTLIRAQDERRLLNEICRLIVRQGDYTLAWVGYALHDANRSVRLMAHEGLTKGYMGFSRISWADTTIEGQGPCGTAIRTRETVLIQDYQQEPGIGPWETFAHVRDLRSSIALPLISRTGVLGAISIYSTRPNAFNDDEVKLLRDLAADLAFGIETLRTRAKHDTAVEQLSFLAYHDPLTHLPNRLLLAERFERARRHQDRGGMIGLMFLGLDNFKQVNDMFGHDLGDRLIVRVIERLKRQLAHKGTLGRYGGDQFVAMLDGVQSRSQLEAEAQAVISTFETPFQIEGHALTLSFSIGISVYPEDGELFDLLLKKADTAMYLAKDKGRNTFEFCTGGMSNHALEQLRLQGMLRNALDNGELFLYYQPQIDLRHGGLFGFEALLRWRHPDLGMIPPATFIPLAESSGLIIPIGEWVLREACRQASIWRASNHPVMVAVNLSALQFQRGNLVDSVASALADAGLPAHLLELELTESMLLRDLDIVEDTLQVLKRMGVKLSIDDFGTGYSSLTYLKRLAVDRLKIDHSFISDLLTNTESAAIVRAIIQLAEALQLDVIAEGAENAEQVHRLSLYGCMRLQGYHFSRPVPAEAASLLLSHNFLKTGNGSRPSPLAQP